MRIAKIDIFDEIGGWGVRADTFKSDLEMLGKVDKITLNINSPGGSVIDAYAIHNLIADNEAHVTGVVYGMAASAASYILTACDEVHMHRDSLLMIHEAWSFTYGNADDLRREADFLDKNSDIILSSYADRAGMTLADLRAKLKEEGGDYWMTAQEAKDADFIDVVIQPQSKRQKAKAMASMFANFNPCAFDTDESSMELPSDSVTETTTVTTKISEVVETTTVEETPVEEETSEDAVEETPVAKTEEPAKESLTDRIVNAFTGTKQLKAELETSRNELTQLKATYASLVAERDTLKAQADKLETLEIALSEAEAQTVTLTNQVQNATVITKEKVVQAAAALVTDHMGVDLGAADTLPEVSDKIPATVLEQYNALSGGERTTFFNKHKDEILAAIAKS